MLGFTHLHLHTEFSLLDGANRIETLPRRIKELSMDSVAITDHGTMYGVIDFWNACEKEGVKPIIGCEVYVAPNGRFSQELPEDKQPYHLVLLAETDEGLRNLNRLVSQAFIDGFYYRPRIDLDLLAEHAEGLIALSACLSGEVSRSVLRNDLAGARKATLRYRDIMGDGNFFLEIQANGLPEQLEVNQALKRLATETGIGLVATCDAHYTRREEARAHEILLCMQTGKRMSDPDRMRMGSDQFYIKSPEEMAAAFADVPQALENTVKIAERCRVKMDFETLHLPAYDVPAGYTSGTYLRDLAYQGLDRRLAVQQADSREAYEERLDYELDVIDRMGYNNYYLIVYDFIDYARSQEIMVGPGRGSGAASLVAYCVGITNLDPLKYNLLFERFLNPARVSMPDFDIDFCYERRGEVIDYVTRKYGQDHVAQVITFGTLAARQAVRDVARALDVSYQETDRLAKLIPNQLNITLDLALESSSELKQEYDQNPVAREVIDTARLFEGMPRHASTHAAGVVISSEPLTDIAPLSRNDDNVVVQYDMSGIEQIGLLKFDFLGLRTLTVLRDTRDMIRDRTGETIDYNTMPMDDPAVYQLISRGDTGGVFQLESAGMTDFMKTLRPETFEDITAGIALYRPGPMEQIPRYVAARHDPSQITYHHPLLEPSLDVTYGCIVYQEQVMQIVRTLAGFSMGQADNVRRAMSKKKPRPLAQYESYFINGGTLDNGEEVPGAEANGVPEDTARKIWDEVMAFAGYAFNKAHSACYAVLAYQTAWLKVYYPVEFMAAILNSFLGNLSQAANYVNQCRNMGIEVLQPDVNTSSIKFTTENGAIRFALAAVKNVGQGALRELIAERSEAGSFHSYGDFLRRVAGSSLNRKMIESLIKSSACDCFGIPRNQMLAVLETYLEQVTRARAEVMDGQLSFFDFGLEKTVPEEPEYPALPVLGLAQQLEMEKETLGLYVTGHPLDPYAQAVKDLPTEGSAALRAVAPAAEGDYTLDRQQAHAERDVRDGRLVIMAGMVLKRNNKSTRNGKMMCFLELEDVEGRYEVICFPTTLQDYAEVIREGAALLIAGRISVRDEARDANLIADEIVLLPEDTAYEAGGRKNPLSGRQHRNNRQNGRDRYGSVPSSAQTMPYEAPIDRSQPPQASTVPPSFYLEIRYPGEVDDACWPMLVATLEYFSGDVPVTVILGEGEGQRELRLDAACNCDCGQLLLNILIRRYGPDRVRFAGHS